MNNQEAINLSLGIMYQATIDWKRVMNVGCLKINGELIYKSKLEYELKSPLFKLTCEILGQSHDEWLKHLGVTQ